MTFNPGKPASAAQQRRDEWIDKYAGPGQPRALLAIIVADGGLGTAGATDCKRMTPATADHLLRLITRSGVTGAAGRQYLARVLRWHYGYSRGAPTANFDKLSATDTAFIRRRAHELVTAHDNSNDGPLIKLVQGRQAT